MLELSGHFIPATRGKIFVTQSGCLPAEKVVLCLPPMFEELNLSRAVIAKQAQYFASQGLPCFVVDYLGCGDSEGDLEKFTAADWIENVLDTGRWLLSQGVQEIILWGVRFGGLLMLCHQQALHQTLPIKRQLLWKPVLKGKPFMNQFIRLKQANSMMKGNDTKTNWRALIEEGSATEVAGYLINKDLLCSIDNLEPPADLLPLSQISWLELGAKTITPVINKLVAKWPEDLFQLECLESSAFWQIPEVFELEKHHQHNLTVILD